MDLLPKTLIAYYFIMFFVCIHRLLDKERALKARHDAFKKDGFNKKSIRDGIYGILFGSILLYISSDYLYFKSYWKFMAVFTLISRVGTIATISIRKPKWPESNVKPSIL